MSRLFQHYQHKFRIIVYMSKNTDNVTLHSKGGRLYVKPADILASKQAKRALDRFKQSSIYKTIQERDRKPSSAA